MGHHKLFATGYQVVAVLTTGKQVAAIATVISAHHCLAGCGCRNGDFSAVATVFFCQSQYGQWSVAVVAALVHCQAEDTAMLTTG